jgi:ribose transport system ATP-binding protein
MNTSGAVVPRFAVRVKELSKHFAGTVALDGVSFDVRAGEVHGLVGLNGSGKSTLIKVMAGYHRPDGGTVEVFGPEGELVSAAWSEAMAFVHQDLGLIPDLTVVENLRLGRGHQMRHGRIDRRAEAREACDALADFGLADTVRLRVGALTRAEATIVAMVRALAKQQEEGTRVLVLDEPTSALPTREAERLLSAMQQVAANGTAVVFVSHRMQEIHAVCDRVTALRNGAVAWSGPLSESSPEHLLSMMIGREVERAGGEYEPPAQLREATAGRAVVRAVGVSVAEADPIDLELRAHEVVGVTGLLGSGVEELAMALSGRQVARTGQVLLEGEAFRPNDARCRTEVGLVPDDRANKSVVAGLSIRENITLPVVDRYVGGGRLRPVRERAAVVDWIRALRIKAAGPEARITSLSGGNQQKCILARWLNAGVKVLVALEPTQGIDVHAKREVLAAFDRAAADGMAVALFSHDPEEVLASCTRVIVLSQGRIALDRPTEGLELVEVLHVMGRDQLNEVS